MAWVPGSIIPSPPCSLGEQKRSQDGAGLFGRMNRLMMLMTFLNHDSGGERTQSICHKRDRMIELTMTALPKTERVCSVSGYKVYMVRYQYDKNRRSELYFYVPSALLFL